MKTWFFSPAAWVYYRLKPWMYKNPSVKVKKELQQLYPSKEEGQLYDSYQIKKLTAGFVVLITGIVSAVCVHLCSPMKDRLTEGAQLKRNEWGAGDYEITLRAKTQEWSREIPYLVEERLLSEEERKEMLDRMYAELPTLIKKDNQDLQHVVGDLELPSQAAGYPFRLTWSSTDSKRVSSRGKVERTGICEEGEQVDLLVEAAYGDSKDIFSYKLTLLPDMPDQQEDFFQLLKEEMEKTGQKESSLKVITLPEYLQGKHITWEEVKPDNSIFLFIISVLSCVMVCRGMDEDLKKSCDKRKRQLLMDYSGFVSKLRLYLSAGLTIKGSFIKIAADYEDKSKDLRKCYLYEELKIACYQFENGVIEEQVYREFGRRCEEMSYKRLSFLLSVHLRQGNHQLLTLLQEEADNALEERRRMARKAGEEAGTKLLLPMMLMLILVMFLILLPAYFDFGNI